MTRAARRCSEGGAGRGASPALLLLALAVTAVAVAPVAADTTLGGPVTTNTALLASDSPYLVTSDLVIQSGATLAIQAGVTLRVAPGVDIVVQSGALRIDGTEAAPVVITSASDGGGTPAAGDWGVLRFENGTNDAGTRLRFTTVRYGSGLELAGASPTFDFVRLETLGGPAIAIDLASFPRGIGNSATGCGVNGVLVPAGDIGTAGSWALRGIPYVVRGLVSVGASPRVTAITPSTAQRLDTTDVTVAGQRLTGASAFQIDGGGVTATILPGGTATQLVVRLDVSGTAALGARSFRVVTPAGIAESTDAALSLTIAPAVPDLIAISPTTAVAGTGNFTLTANGRRFDLGAEIVLGGAPLATTRISSTQLTALVPASAITNPGDRLVVVRNPDPVTPGAFLTSAPRTLTVQAPQIALAPNPLLVISGQVSNLVLSIPFSAPAGGLTFSVVSANTTVATVPAQVTIPQGSASTPVQVQGGTSGSTTVTATRAGFLGGTAQVDVIPPPILVPVTPLLARPVGVQVGPPPDGGEDTLAVTPLLGSRTGVVVGPVLLGLSPGVVPRGAANLTITASGRNLDLVTTVTIEPDDGLTVVGPTGAAPDGSSVTFQVSVDPAAPSTLRRVLLRTASSFVPAASPSADRLLVTRGAPVVTSIAPIEVVPGSVGGFVVRGVNLEGATEVTALPATGLVFSVPVIDAAGTEITLSLQVLATAPLGDRTITVTTAGGTSSATPAAANTLHVVTALGTPITPLVAPPVGVQVGPPPGDGPDELPVNPLLAPPVGAVVGSAITGVVPAAANVGTTNLALTIQGAGLGGTTAVSFVPPAGITINGAPVVAGDGRSVTLDVSIAANAPTVTRVVRVATASGFVPAAVGADRFTVTLPPPVITAIVPNRGVAGTALTLVVHGRDLTGATQVSFEPPDGVAIQNPPLIDANGVSATVTLTLATNAPLGQRVVRIATPGGMSTATGSVANRFEVSNDAGFSATPLVAPPVGVQVGPPLVDVPQPEAVGPFLAAAVGVQVGSPPTEEPQPEPVGPFAAPSVGVLVGSGVTGTTPAAVAPGTASFDLTVNGIGLGGVTAVTVQPSTGVTVNGAPVISPDGTSLVVNLSIALDAPRLSRRVLAATATGVLPAVRPGVDQLFVGRPPSIASIVPNVVAIGSIFTMTINGADLDLATGVALLPPGGATIGTLTVNAAGTQLTVPIELQGSIVPGARVVTLTTPAGTSSTSATPANTLNIVGALPLGVAEPEPPPPPPPAEEPDPVEPSRLAPVDPGPAPPNAAPTASFVPAALSPPRRRDVVPIEACFAPRSETAGVLPGPLDRVRDDWPPAPIPAGDVSTPSTLPRPPNPPPGV